MLSSELILVLYRIVCVIDAKLQGSRQKLSCDFIVEHTICMLLVKININAVPRKLNVYEYKRRELNPNIGKSLFHQLIFELLYVVNLS